MIALSCSHCSTKLKIRDELSGRALKCPHCQQMVRVPSPTEDATVPPRFVPESATLAPPLASGSPVEAVTETSPTKSRSESPPEVLDEVAGSYRYKLDAEIARGGMGAILRAIDQDIQREVAVKFLLNQADAKQKARFVEEAQITGQLEHPNIVPIHQFGVGADGRCFFSMKMVKGNSLAEIFRQCSKPRQPGSGDNITLGRLLTIFSSICNAMAYAHSRSVIHRDLKPANVMVGDFGEVYVMDWGLAKVKGEGLQATNEPAEPATPSTFERQRAASVTTTPRESLGGDLTHAGAIMGTPAYMPPEQALGEEVDARADIYSLGAILYEILTLTPPVGRGGDAMAVVLRVAEGKIDEPAKRAPDRAKAGWIPSELASIAMKALATNRDDRYQTVESLQRDIQLFLEGRSVSAKQDTAWEMFKKLVRRNKGASISTAGGLAVLAVVASVFLKVNYDARVDAESANARFLKEQRDKQTRGKVSAPLFFDDARQSAERGNLPYALAQVEVALDYDPELADAWLLLGQLKIVSKEWPLAAPALEECLRRKPGDADTAELLKLCRRNQENDPATLLSISSLLAKQKAFTLAGRVLTFERDVQASRMRVLKLLNQQLRLGYPALPKAVMVMMDKEGRFHLDLGNQVEHVADLKPIAGMPLSNLVAMNCNKVQDLTPLKGMQLTSLTVQGCRKVRDLSPLEGMPLVSLNIRDTQIGDLSVLVGMPLRYIDIVDCPKIRDLTPLKDLPLKNISMGQPALGHPPKDWEKILRHIPTLQSINHKSADLYWAEYDARNRAK